MTGSIIFLIVWGIGMLATYTLLIACWGSTGKWEDDKMPDFVFLAFMCMGFWPLALAFAAFVPFYYLGMHIHTNHVLKLKEVTNEK